MVDKLAVDDIGPHPLGGQSKGGRLLDQTSRSITTAQRQGLAAAVYRISALAVHYCTASGAELCALLVHAGGNP